MMQNLFLWIAGAASGFLLACTGAEMNKELEDYRRGGGMNEKEKKIQIFREFAFSCLFLLLLINGISALIISLLAWIGV